ncbi:hypothetical protein LX90_002181 [Lentzea flava]|nr:hypothetical protein [Lentzea flava]
MKNRRHQAQPGQLAMWGVYELEAQAVARPWDVQKRPDGTGPNENKPAGQSTCQCSSRLLGHPLRHMSYLR